MKSKFFLLSLILLLTLGLMTACGGGDDDDDDDAVDDDAVDDDIADDDVADDDVTDDDIVDDDTVDDDTVDDDTVDDDTIEDYEPLTCTPDAAIWDEDLPITGDAITDTVEVVVINDLTCEPIEGAKVISGDAKEEVATDANGAATLSGLSGATLITAQMDDYWARSFLVDANKILFRLRPDGSALPYFDSADGNFMLGGSDLTVDQASFGLAGIGLLNDPVYVGAALAGFSRQNALQTDFENLFTASTFEAGFSIDLLGFEVVFDAPENVWIPTVDGVPAPGLDHPYYKIRETDAVDEMALMGLVLRLRTNEISIPDILNIIAIIESGDLNSLDRDLIDTLQSIAYAGIQPSYEPETTPDIDVVEVNDEDLVKLTTTVTRSGSLAGDNDYLAILFAEVANRSLVPLAISHLNDGTKDMDYALVPDARYYVLTAATNLLTEEEQNFALRMSKIEDLEAGVDVDGFVPYLEDVDYSQWESSCTVSWTLPTDRANMTPNLITLMIHTYWNGNLLFVDLPATETSFTLPSGLDWICSDPLGAEEADVIGVLASYTPDLDVNARDYNALIADVEAASVNISYDIIGSLFPTE